ncbi:hypothetical protein NQT72_15525 [Pseudoalteromonas carrageenovora]|uniref:hypothetical protein n=1 Tax=Pseudoalteromonas carrageenovora TaxID=227 RepID=UPI002118024D|nr:hypothetical protein [Pseudoalteromonas carrageenovora]MCQ8890904.1 hypothetical protein [Pseudoalteromonas carrageenovora]
MNEEKKEMFREFKHMLGSGALRILLNIKIGEPALDGLAEQLHRDNAQFHNNNINIAKCYKFLKYQLDKFGLAGIQQVDRDEIDLTRLFRFKFDFRIEDSEVNFLIPDAWAILRLPNTEDQRIIRYRIFMNSTHKDVDSVKLSETIMSLHHIAQSQDKFEWIAPSGIKFVLYEEKMLGFSEYATDYLERYYVQPYLQWTKGQNTRPKILTLPEIISKV